MHPLPCAGAASLPTSIPAHCPTTDSALPSTLYCGLTTISQPTNTTTALPEQTATPAQ